MKFFDQKGALSIVILAVIVGAVVTLTTIFVSHYLETEKNQGPNTNTTILSNSQLNIQMIDESVIVGVPIHSLWLILLKEKTVFDKGISTKYSKTR